MKPGTLDDTSWTQPIFEGLWTLGTNSGVHISEHMLNYEVQPDDFSQLNSGKPIQALWRALGLSLMGPAV